MDFKTKCEQQVVVLVTLHLLVSRVSNIWQSHFQIIWRNLSMQDVLQFNFFKLLCFIYVIFFFFTSKMFLVLDIYIISI